jgi:hypothetical protein
VNYKEHSAWQYNAIAFQGDRNVPRFSPLGMAGIIQLNGTEVEACPAQLVVPFTASGASLHGSFPSVCIGDSALTLLSADMDFRQESAGPTATAVAYDIWNSNEVKFSASSRCLTRWSHTLLSAYGAPNLFSQNMLGTHEGWARLDGQSDPACPGSANTALLGVLTKAVDFDPTSGASRDWSATTLGGVGVKSALIKYDPAYWPPEDFRSSDASTERAAGLTDRAKVNIPGSVVVIPRVELRWNAGGQLIRDTYIELTNDGPADVMLRTYYVQGDPPLAHDPESGERAHAGWTPMCGLLMLSANQPVYWSVATGLPAGAISFVDVDPGPPPGRPTAGPSGERFLRGYLMVWAVNSAGEEIQWNHLSGRATVVDVNDSSAWTYSPITVTAFDQGGAIGPGDATGTPFILNFDGLEYGKFTTHLLMSYFQPDSGALSGQTPVMTDDDLTLLVVPTDLRASGTGPGRTNVTFTVWNQNGTKMTGMSRCVTGWDQEYFRAYADPNYFMNPFAQTTAARAMLWGEAHASCPGSAPTALLGVWHSDLTFYDAARAAVGEVLPTLGGTTTDTTVIMRVDPTCGAAYRRPGDADLDGDVDLVDAAAMSRCFWSTVTDVRPGCSAVQFSVLNVDHNNIIDLSDYDVIQDHWIGPR